MPFINDRLAANRTLIAEQPTRGKARQSRFRFEPAQVMDHLRQRIVGQVPALQAISDVLQVIKAELAPEERPLGVCLLMGPTGVGKTETVRQLAIAIHGNADALCRIDMNTLSQAHYASALTGAPPGYVGSKEGHTLYDAERIRGSYSKPGIVLFDELEKASPEVIRSLLNVLDSGWLTLPAGNQQIDFRNALIFMTSNLGARELARYQSRFMRGWRRLLRPSPERQQQLLDQALQQHFDPEFINRIDRILHYQPLPDSHISDLWQLELANLNRRLARQQVQLSVSPNAAQWLQRSYDHRYGARDLARLVKSQLMPAVAEALLAAADATHFHADLYHGHLVVNPVYVK
ncbi:MAG: AAA family ATPase [Marinobacter sp.]|nr:AAA family ATPase [Marinobacter sp.]